MKHVIIFFFIIQRYYHLILRKLWLNVLASASLSKKMKKNAAKHLDLNLMHCRCQYRCVHCSQYTVMLRYKQSTGVRQHPIPSSIACFPQIPGCTQSDNKSAHQKLQYSWLLELVINKWYKKPVVVTLLIFHYLNIINKHDMTLVLSVNLHYTKILHIAYLYD